MHFDFFHSGAKIACFAPENFTDPQAEALNEHCWNNGLWVGDDTPLTKSLYTQPHRFYPLYLPLQAIIIMSPIVFWNMRVKSHLIAALRGSEEFLENLLDMVTKDDEMEEVEKRSKAVDMIKTFHETCLNAARLSDLAKRLTQRVVLELVLTTGSLYMQFTIYNHQIKDYKCFIPELYPDEIMCTVPILDMLDMIWSIVVSTLFVAILINLYVSMILYYTRYSDFQPMFFNNLPYGDTDDFNERIVWDDHWVKESYILLLKIFGENNPIMTKAYVLRALKPKSYSREILEAMGQSEMDPDDKSLPKDPEQDDGDGPKTVNDPEGSRDEGALATTQSDVDVQDQQQSDEVFDDSASTATHEKASALNSGSPPEDPDWVSVERRPSESHVSTARLTLRSNSTPERASTGVNTVYSEEGYSVRRRVIVEADSSTKPGVKDYGMLTVVLASLFVFLSFL